MLLAGQTRMHVIACAATIWAAPARAETLRVGKSTLTSFTYTLLEVGMQSGIFEKHGLTIESSAFGGGPRLIQGMTAGAIDIGLDGGTDMALIVKGAPMKGIAPLSGAPVEMVVAVKAGGPIKTVADLKGKKIAITGAGTLTGWITRELVKSQGWAESDVNYVMSSNIAASRALLEGRRDRRGHHRHVDDAGERAARRGAAVVHLRRPSEGLPHADHLRHRQGDGGKAAGGARVHGGVARDHRLRQGQQGEDRSIVQHVLGFHPDVLNGTYDRVINTYSTDGKFNPRALAVLARSYVDLKLLDHEPDMTKLYTEEFLPKK